MRAKQVSIFDQLQTPSEKRAQKRLLVHGGAKTKGKRKVRRPLATKKWIHLILKSDKAYRQYSMLNAKNADWINKLVKAKAKKFGVELKDFVNMGNHLHLKIRITNRIGFQKFLKAITAMIARYVTGARKGKTFGRFWQGLAFTRVLQTSLEEMQLRGYFKANRVQRQSGYQAREEYLRKLNLWMRLQKALPS